MAKAKKWSLEYYVKQRVGGWDGPKALTAAVQQFIKDPESCEFVFSGSPLELANAIYLFWHKRSKGSINGGFFPTPLPVALDLARMLPGDVGTKVLDPGAGFGNLSWAAMQEGYDAVGVEIGTEWAELASLFGLPVTQGDFLGGYQTPKFDAVMVNPPFGNLFGHKDIAVDFMTRIADWSAGGTYVAAILPNGWLDKADKAHRAVIERYLVSARDSLPADTFKPLTSVGTEMCLLMTLDDGPLCGEQEDMQAGQGADLAEPDEPDDPQDVIEVTTVVPADILTQTEWRAEWAPIDPLSPENKAMDLNEYARKCAHHKASWCIPRECSSNSRYDVYIEWLLSKGVAVPDDIIATLEPDANQHQDVPLVGARLAAITVVPDPKFEVGQTVYFRVLGKVIETKITTRELAAPLVMWRYRTASNHVLLEDALREDMPTDMVLDICRAVATLSDIPAPVKDFAGEIVVKFDLGVSGYFVRTYKHTMGRTFAEVVRIDKEHYDRSDALRGLCVYSENDAGPVRAVRELIKEAQLLTPIYVERLEKEVQGFRQCEQCAGYVDAKGNGHNAGCSIAAPAQELVTSPVPDPTPQENQPVQKVTLSPLRDQIEVRTGKLCSGPWVIAKLVKRKDNDLYYEIAGGKTGSVKESGEGISWRSVS